MDACSPRQGRADRRARPGQNIVELALMLPLLTLILVGAIDFGRAFIHYNRLTNAVEQGALFGMKYPAYLRTDSVSNNLSADPNNITYHVRQAAANGSGNVDTALANIATRCFEGRSDTLKGGTGSCANASANDSIEVSATYAFRPITGQIVRFFGTTFQMRKAVRVVIQ